MEDEIENLKKHNKQLTLDLERTKIESKFSISNKENQDSANEKQTVILEKNNKELQMENHKLKNEILNLQLKGDSQDESFQSFISNHSRNLKPLKEDYATKITKLQKRINQLEDENQKLQKEGKTDNPAFLQIERENRRLRMKVNELEHRHYNH